MDFETSSFKFQRFPSFVLIMTGKMCEQKCFFPMNRYRKSFIRLVYQNYQRFIALSAILLQPNNNNKNSLSVSTRDSELWCLRSRCSVLFAYRK